MADKDWFDDFMDYQLSRCEGRPSPANASGCLPCILGIVAVFVILALFF